MDNMTVHLTVTKSSGATDRFPIDDEIFLEVIETNLIDGFYIVKQKDSINRIPVSRIVNIHEFWDDEGETK